MCDRGPRGALQRPQSSDYQPVLDERRSLDEVAVTPEMMARSIEIQNEVARRGQHRLSIPDLIVAAAAERSGLTVLHYDADFERLAGATRLRHEWVVPRGSV